MRKYIYMFLATAVFTACSQKEDAVYGNGNNYSKRTNETTAQYASALESATNGWLLSMYVGIDQRYGGYNYVVKFQDGKVTATSEATTEEDTTLYSLNFQEKGVITFDTYNRVLHQFVEPSYLFPQGKIGDNQLEIESYENGVFTLKGKRSGNLMTLRRLERDGAEYLAKIREKQTLFRVSDPYPVTINGKEVDFEIQPSNRQFIVREGNTEIKKAYIYTENGFKLYEPITIEGKTFSEFVLSADNSQITADDTSIVAGMLYDELPFDFRNNSLRINMLEDGCSTNSEFSSVYNLSKSVTYRSAAYMIAPYIRLGRLNNRNDVAMNFTVYYDPTRYYEMRYLIDFLPVAGKPTQVNIVPVEQGFYWDFYGSYPLVEELTQYSPYEMRDMNGDGTQYQFVSTKNSDITFISLSDNLAMPYDFDSNYAWVYMRDGYVCDQILQLYNTYNNYSVGGNSYTLVDYFRLGGDNGVRFFLQRGTTNYTADYGIDYLPVPCDAAKINFIDKGRRGASNTWTRTNSFNFSYLAPISNLLLSKAPYITSESGNYMRFESVEDPDFWFYIAF